MKHFFSGSFLRTAVFIVVISVLPVLGIVVLTGIEHNEKAIRQAETSAVASVRTVAQVQETIAAGAHTLLTTLAQMNDIRNRSFDASDFLSRLDYSHAAYADVFIVDDTGHVIATKQNPGQPVQVKDRLYFSRALKEKTFVAGEVAFSRLANAPVFHFGYRLEIPGRKPVVLATGIRLDYYNFLLGQLSLHEDAQIYLADAKGKLVFSKPYSKDDAIRISPDLWNTVTSQEGKEGMFYYGTGEERSLVAYHRLILPGETDAYMKIILTIPEKSLLTEAKPLLYRDIALLCIALAAMLAMTIYLVSTLLSPPVRKMLEAAKRYGSGDYQIRLDDTNSVGELRELGNSMNTMASALEKRETDLITAREVAESAGKAKSEFLANMSHEIRTPMNAIIGMAYLSLKGELSPQQRGYISKIHEAGSDLLRVINDILELSKIDAGKLGMETIPFAIRDIFADNQRRLSSSAREKGIKLLFTVGSDVPRLFVGDPLRLGQVMGYLLDSAVDNTSSGSVTVSCKLDNVVSNQAYLSIIVQDTGSGMLEGQKVALQRLFAGEATPLPDEAPNKSSGLGLLLAHKLVRAMGGSLTLETEQGKGSFITLRVGLGIRASSRTSGENLFKGIRVLAVDDDHVSLTMHKELLENFGMIVTVETDPMAALQLVTKADAENTPFNLIIVDWRMPDLDGVEFTRKVKAELNLQFLPSIIMLSAYGWGGITIQAEQAGVDVFLHKPINESVLLDTIMNLLKIYDEVLPADEEKTASMEENEAMLAGLSILVVEDNPINQQVAQGILSASGIEVTLASNGQEALELFDPTSQQPPFVMVLMDLQMPIMDGFEATRQLRALNTPWATELPILAMTAHSREAEFPACIRAGLNDHVSKPIVVNELFSSIRHWLPAPPSPALEEGKTTLREIYQAAKRNDTQAMTQLSKADALAAGPLRPGHLKKLQEMVRQATAEDVATYLERMNMALQFLH